jgi:hypothetical protein
MAREFPGDLIDKVHFREGRRVTVSLLRFASIKCLEHVKDSADLAPQDSFIAAETIEREIGRIG